LGALAVALDGDREPREVCLADHSSELTHGFEHANGRQAKRHVTVLLSRC